MNHPPASSRIHGLDTLRALAIVLVFMYHYMVFVSANDTFGFLSRIGWVGVDLFFALSGYLIGNQILAGLRDSRGFSLTNFYTRRLLRTLPNYYVLLALYALWPWFRGERELPPLWKFLTFTQNLFLQPGTAFSHAWSLCIEEQFYMVLPALAVMVAAMRGARTIAWLLVAFSFIAGMAIRAWCWAHYVGDSAQGELNYMKYIYYSSFCRFDELVAGVALALLKNHHGALWRRITAHGNATGALGLLATGATFACWLADDRGIAMTVFGYPMLAVSFALLIVAAVSERSVLRSARVPGAASLALWSYAIYLTHKQVCVLARPALAALGYGPDSAVAVIAMTALSIFSGWLLYRAVETPFLLLRDRWVPSNARRRADTAAVGTAVPAK
jgi:peptidoglycan/LPS O-acetylase OafA/YrhL